MADRTVVRQGRVVSLSLGIVLTVAWGLLANGPDGSSSSAPAPPKASEKTKAVETAFERTPYKIRAWISVDPRARVDSRGRETLIRNFKMMVTRFVGPPWELEIAEGEGPLAVNLLEDLTAKEMLPLTKGFDKGWLIRIEPGEGGTLSLAGREFDALTSKVGLLCRRSAFVMPDAPRALLQLCMDIFAPVAQISTKSGDHVKLIVQGGMLQSADPVGQIIPVGTLFRPVQIFYKPDGGGVNRIDVIKNTYCTVESIEGGVANCLINTKLADPFTNKVIGKDKKVAIGVKPASIPTRLRFLTYDNKPAAGYKLTARATANGQPREVGATDREGRIVLEPNFADGLVVLRLLAADIEPLTEFYMIPGEQVEERQLKIDPRSEAVRIESEIASLRDEIVDLLAMRKRLESRIETRIKQDIQNWDEIKPLIDEFRSLPQKDSFETRLAKLEETLTSDQKKADESKLRKYINTPQAQHIVGDTRTLIEQHLADAEIEAYERAYAEHLSQSSGGKSTVKAMPKAPTIGGGSTANRTDIAPVGSGFKVTMPGPPSQSSQKTADGVSDIRAFRYVDPSRGTFSVEYWDYPAPLSEAESSKGVEAEHERLLSSLSGAKVGIEAPMNIEGRTGQEIEFVLPARDGNIAMGMIVRIVVVKSRIYSVSFSGTKNDLRGPASQDFLNSFKLTAGASKAPPASGDAPPAASTPPPAAKKDAGKNLPKGSQKAPGGNQPF